MGIELPMCTLGKKNIFFKVLFNHWHLKLSTKIILFTNSTKPLLISCMKFHLYFSSGLASASKPQKIFTLQPSHVLNKMEQFHLTMNHEITNKPILQNISTAPPVI